MNKLIKNYFTVPGDNWMQSVSIVLLIVAITVVAIIDQPQRGKMIGLLVTLFMWTIARKDKKRRDRQGKNSKGDS